MRCGHTLPSVKFATRCATCTGRTRKRASRKTHTAGSSVRSRLTHIRVCIHAHLLIHCSFTILPRNEVRMAKTRRDTQDALRQSVAEIREFLQQQSVPVF